MIIEIYFEYYNFLFKKNKDQIYDPHLFCYAVFLKKKPDKAMNLLDVFLN